MVLDLWHEMYVYVCMYVCMYVWKAWHGW